MSLKDKEKLKEIEDYIINYLKNNLSSKLYDENNNLLIDIYNNMLNDDELFDRYISDTKVKMPDLETFCNNLNKFDKWLNSNRNEKLYINENIWNVLYEGQNNIFKNYGFMTEENDKVTEHSQVVSTKYNALIKPMKDCVDYAMKVGYFNPFTVIENRHQTDFENKQLAMDYYLDLCDWCEGAERESYIEMYLKIKHSKANIITDGSKVESRRYLSAKEFEEEKASVQKYLEEELEY